MPAALHRLLPLLGVALLSPVASQANGLLLAQSESFLLGPGSKVGPATQVKPENCVTAADGTITCDTRLENPPSDTPAKPQFNQFNN